MNKEINMSFLFGSQDPGPTDAEILAKQREEADKRRRGLENLAIKNNQTGVVQLLGKRNTSFKAPGGGSQ